MKRLVLLAGILLLLAGLGLAADDFTFVIMSDRTGGADQPVFERAVNEIALLHPDFVVTVGDLIEGYAGNDVRAKQWDEMMAIMKQVNCPVYYAPGNHDIGDPESAKLFFAKTGRPPYYSFDEGQSHFVVLNTALYETYDQVDPIQRKWLEQDLLLNQMKSHIFVFMHKTFWLTGTVPDPASDPMHQLFKKYHVTAVFCGHGHSYVSQVIDGIRYAEIGATGVDIGTPNTGLGIFDQYAIARIQGTKFNYAVVEVGHINGPDLVSPTDVKMVDDINSKYVRIGAVVHEGKKIQLSPANVYIFNATGKTITDTVHFSVQQNWKTGFTSLPVNVRPGDSLLSPFPLELKRNKPLFPLPALTFVYPFGVGTHRKYYSVEKAFNMTRIYACDKAVQPIVIDGQLDDPAWKKAASISSFAGFDGNPTKADPTVVKFTEDGANLYFAAICSDSSMDKIKATITKRDDPVHQDDCIGLLITSDDRKSIYQFYINALGTVWDQRIDAASGKPDLAWNMDCEVKTSRDNKAWIVEMRMPLKDFGYYPAKDTAGIMLIKIKHELPVNIRRKHVRSGESALWMLDWAYNPDNFGVVEIPLKPFDARYEDK